MRYAIEGNRPGTTLWVAGSTVTAQEDGSYRFTEAQREELKARGHKLTEVAIEKIDAATEAVNDADAALRAVENAAAAEENNAKINRAPSKESLTPKKRR